MLIFQFSIILDYDASELKISKIFNDYKELINICNIFVFDKKKITFKIYIVKIYAIKYKNKIVDLQDISITFKIIYID